LASAGGRLHLYQMAVSQEHTVSFPAYVLQ